MAGYNPREPRNKQGEWTQSGGKAGDTKPYSGWPTFEPSPVSQIPRRAAQPPLNAKTPYIGRPAPNFKIPKEKRGKPRTLYQQAAGFNPSDPRASGAKLSNEAKRYMREKQLSAADEKLYDAMKSADPDKARSFLNARTVNPYDTFSNVKGGSRLNRNIGKPPKGMSKDATGERAANITKRDVAASKRLQKSQASARQERDAILNTNSYYWHQTGSHDAVLRKKGNNEKIWSSLGKVDRGFRKVEKTMKKWFG